MESLSHLTGASHSQNRSSATSHGTRVPCYCDFFLLNPTHSLCDDPVRLDVQLLRVCRQVFNESALLPYAENHFILSHTLRNPFGETFVARFNLEKRSAI